MGLCQDKSCNDLLKVDLFVAKAFAIELTKEVSHATAAVYLAGCTGCYDLFLERRLITENPFRNPLLAIPGKQRFPVKPTPRMSSPEVRAMLHSNNSPRDQAILALLFGGGLRRQEVANLRIKDISLSGCIKIKLYYTKSHNFNEQTLPNWAEDAIIRWYTLRMNEVFGDYDKSLFGLSVEGLHKNWKRMLKAAKIEVSYGIHSARCTAINRLRELGYDKYQIMDFSRHASIKQVEGYLRQQTVVNNPGRHLSYE